MDYSSLQDENPGGPSPWATSPQHSKTSFSPPTSEIPPSPLPEPSPYGESPEQSHGSIVPHVQGAEDSQPAAGENGAQAAVEDPPYANAAIIREQHFQAQQQEQQRQEGTSRPHGQANRPRDSRAQQKLQAKVTGLERTGRKDPILRFDVYTNLPKFRTTQFRDVRRTHSEFQKFAEHLIAQNPEALVPAVPPPLTSAGAGTDEDESRVKASMQRWLNTVCSNDVLMRDEEMVFFVESDFGYSPVVRKKQPATGVRRKVIKQFAPPPDECVELADARPIVKMFYLGTMDAQQKVDKVVKHRRSLGTAELELGQRLTQMKLQETHPGLSNAYHKLGKVISATGDLHAAQGTAEATTLGDPLAYASATSFIAKETLTNRQLIHRDLLSAQASTKSKLGAADRLKASSRVSRDKVDEAIASLEEAKSTETHLTDKYKRVTDNLVNEQRKWFKRSAQEVRDAIREYTIRQIEAERRTLAMLESVRPDIRAIDGSGGLSRLGREAHPERRRQSLASSQGPKGDAWSGVPRRADSSGLNRSLSGSVAGGLPVPEEDEEEESGRKRSQSGAKGVEEDEDRIDARNAASRLAQTTF